MYSRDFFLELINIDATLGEENFLQNIQYSFEEGKRYAIMGETGSGKTMLAKIMAGLEPTVNGFVRYKEVTLKDPLELLIPGHPKIAYLSQYFELPKNYYVKDYLDFENQIEEIQAFHLKKICRIEHLLNRKTQAMSGGEKQRVALAKKLMTMPELLILDEPFAHLDFSNKQIMKSVIDDYINTYDANSILITHDSADVFEKVDELLILHNGSLIASGNPKELYDKPPNIYVAQLLGPCIRMPIEELCFDTGVDLKNVTSILLRPDFFEITNEGGDFSGIVKDSTFNGFSFVITVAMSNEHEIYLYHPSSCPIGVIVKVLFRRNYLHFIP